jgi:hypothetical protein
VHEDGGVGILAAGGSEVVDQVVTCYFAHLINILVAKINILFSEFQEKEGINYELAIMNYEWRWGFTIYYWWLVLLQVLYRWGAR